MRGTDATSHPRNKQHNTIYPSERWLYRLPPFRPYFSREVHFLQRRSGTTQLLLNCEHAQTYIPYVHEKTDILYRLSIKPDRPTDRQTAKRERLDRDINEKKGIQKHARSEASRNPQQLAGGSKLGHAQRPDVSSRRKGRGHRQLRRPFRRRRQSLPSFAQLGFQVLDKVDVSFLPASLVRQLGSKPLVFFLATPAELDGIGGQRLLNSPQAAPGFLERNFFFGATGSRGASAVHRGERWGAKGGAAAYGTRWALFSFPCTLAKQI